MQDDKLNPAHIEALVITHADFFERELRPLLAGTQPALNQKLDKLLEKAGYDYAGDARMQAPTKSETVELLGEIHVAMEDGPEKSTLGKVLMKMTGLTRPSPSSPGVSP